MMAPIIMPPIYRPPEEKITKYVGVQLYIFSDHKKTIPLFTTQYAGRENAKTIEKLAQDDSGNPWIKANKRMYLTKVSNPFSPDGRAG
jgi:hypothetical protein